MNINKRNWFVRHKILTTALVLIVLIGVAAAAGGNNTNVNNTPTNSTATNNQSKSQASSTKPAVVTAHVGSTVNIGGNKGLAVNLQQVIDPAQPDNEFSSADAGKRFVAVKIQITNNGTASYTDDANSNLTLIGSDNQSYTADFSGVSGCTNFSSGQYILASGASTTGCVNYQLPNGVNPSKVQFTSESGFSSSTGEWLVP